VSFIFMLLISQLVILLRYADLIICMKKVEAVIKPGKLTDVLDKLRTFKSGSISYNDIDY